MDTPQAPPAPNPQETARQQSQMNRETAITQYGLNATNQNTPQGSLSYRQIGTWADGTPRYEANTTLSQGEQGIFDANQGARQNVANIARDQSGRIGGLLGTPFSFNGLPQSVTNVNTDIPITSQIADAGPIQRSIGGNDYEASRKSVEDAIYSRLNPQLQQQRSSLETQLINKGLRPGTPAWNQAITLNNQGQNDARMQAVLAGGQEQSRLFGMEQAAGQFANQAQQQQYGQNYQNAGFQNQAQNQQFNQGLSNANLSNSQRAAEAALQLQQRNQPINEITALMSGSQVSMPNFQNTPTPGVAPTDFIGAQQQALNQQNVGFQAEQAQNQALMSGLFGLGSAAIGGATGGGLGRGMGSMFGGWGGR